VEGVAYLIRHAKAGDRGAWQGPDELRPLTKGGARQADGLAERLGGEPIARVISSPAVRCLDTVPAKKGSVWVLDVADGAVVRGTYRPPPEV
jgi:broad specificity phosphatase PhoE